MFFLTVLRIDYFKLFSMTFFPFQLFDIMFYKTLFSQKYVSNMRTMIEFIFGNLYVFVRFTLAVLTFWRIKYEHTKPSE